MLSAEPAKAITLRAQTVSAQPKCSGGTSPNNAAAGDAWWPAPDMVAASGLPAAPARCCSSARPDLRSSSTRTAPARSIRCLPLRYISALARRWCSCQAGPRSWRGFLSGASSWWLVGASTALLGGSCAGSFMPSSCQTQRRMTGFSGYQGSPVRLDPSMRRLVVSQRKCLFDRSWTGFRQPGESYWETDALSPDL